MTLCDILGSHTTALPLVTPALEHVGYRCGGCAAHSGLDGLFPPPAGLRCLTCGGPLADVQWGVPGARWENERGGSFCSRACWREPVKA